MFFSLWALDYEIVATIGIAAAGVWLMISEARAHRRDAEERIALHARLAAVEQMICASSPFSIAERVAALEASIELVQRVTALECRPKVSRRPKA